MLDEQIKEVQHYKPKIVNILQIVAKLASPLDMSAAADKLSGLLDGHIKINMKSSFANSFIENNLPVAHLLKIGLLLMLCFSSFMIKFHYHKKSMKYRTSKAAIEYDETQNEKNIYIYI